MNANALLGQECRNHNLVDKKNNHHHPMCYPVVSLKMHSRDPKASFPLQDLLVYSAWSFLICHAVVMFSRGIYFGGRSLHVLIVVAEQKQTWVKNQILKGKKCMCLDGYSFCCMPHSVDWLGRSFETLDQLSYRKKHDNITVGYSFFTLTFPFVPICSQGCKFAPSSTS